MAEAFGQKIAREKQKQEEMNCFHTFVRKDPIGLPESSYNASKKLKEPNKTILNEGLGRVDFATTSSTSFFAEDKNNNNIHQAIKSSEFSLFTVFAKDQLVRDTETRGNI